MSRIFTITLILSAFLCISCENKALVPSKSDADEVSDSDEVSDDDNDSGTELISDLKVGENKENTLSCRLTFSTSDEVKTFVKYYSDTHKGYKISEDSATSEHYFFLWGMRENRDYKIEIYDAGNGELLATTEFHSGNAPDYLPPMYPGEKNLEKTAEGFVLFQYAATAYEQVFPVAVMVDTDGEVVWYYEYDQWYLSSFGDVAWDPEKRTILIGLLKDSSAYDSLAEEAIEIDLEGNIVWKSPEIMSYYYGPGSWNHAYYKMKDGSVTFPQVVYDGCIVGDRIVNLDADSYAELWSWDYRDYFEKPDCSANTGGDVWLDWTHTNSVSMFKEDGIVYVNSRNFSTFFKIDMSSGAIIWRLGKDGDFTFVGDKENPWFELAHEPEINGVNGNKVIFFDNGTAERGFSRIVEYTIDETNMTAEMTFEFDGRDLGKGWWSEYWGDADRLENDNIFVTAGFYDMQQTSRFFEVTHEGEVVWELFLERNNDWQISLYKADKFVPPLEFLK
ncbi:aryl-sulfate sulfotransferase [bacterium]|nr:aryl-sulfate sulfotransferase [bacterium]